jgi:hypothetical protein
MIKKYFCVPQVEQLLDSLHESRELDTLREHSHTTFFKNKINIYYLLLIYKSIF